MRNDLGTVGGLLPPVRAAAALYRELTEQMASAREHVMCGIIMGDGAPEADTALIREAETDEHGVYMRRQLLAACSELAEQAKAYDSEIALAASAMRQLLREMEVEA